ncbi:MAG TPA: replication-associated recombination protein A [Bacteroidia bacterium]|nr:replication-associated recombination protein A [Bacteroidia bacterium]
MNSAKEIPLAERIRPVNLSEIAGQQHLVGPGKMFQRIIESGILPSMILWGPPGVGKTTLARIFAGHFNLPLYTLSAVSSGVKDVREVISKAASNGQAILFIDEIHRFSKSQQDSLLAAVEKGTVKLIGATTENPSFEVIQPLLSRCQVYVLEHLDKEDLEQLLHAAITRDVILSKLKIELKETTRLIALSGGDARKLLNLLELVVNAGNSKEITITDKLVAEVVDERVAFYDKGGEQHYDIISAFIKSMRGSDPNGALYWLARMIDGGEDPKFIARRMLILSSEDIGNANPNALVLATSCFQAVEMIGYPECDLILAQTAVYLATSPKSNASYLAIRSAMSTVKSHGDLPVPFPLRNAPTKLMKQLDYGTGYQYAHDFPGNFALQEFLPEKISGTKFYEPGNNDRERIVKEWLRSRWLDKYGY